MYEKDCFMGYVHSRNGVVGLPEGSGMESGTCVCHRFDGWGAYSVAKADMPNVKALMDAGCYTLKNAVYFLHPVL